MKNKPLISICIPTYNRSAMLRKTIESIIVQKEFDEGKIEVVISDNASSDDTYAVCAEYAKQYANILVNKNENNIGDKNFPLVLSLGNGEYRKLCSDRFLFTAGSLEYMCKIVSRYRDDEPYICWSNGHARFESDEKQFEYEDFLLNASFWLTSITCFGLWDKDCHDIEKDTEACALSLWQLDKCLQILDRDEGGIIVNRRLLNEQSMQKKDMSYGVYKVFHNNYLSIIKRYVNSIDILEFLEKDVLFYHLTDLLVLWKKNKSKVSFSNEEDLEALISKDYRNKTYWKEYKRYYFKRSLVMLAKEMLKKE